MSDDIILEFQNVTKTVSRRHGAERCLVSDPARRDPRHVRRERRRQIHPDEDPVRRLSLRDL